MRKGDTEEPTNASGLREVVEHISALDRMVHEPARLAILLWLVREETISYRVLQAQTKLSSGNLSVQLIKLETAGYLEAQRAFRGRRRETTYRLTLAGRAAWDTYWEHMSPILNWLEESPPADEHQDAEERSS